eukprot:13260244-Alexandrium_andersonii.AAC.1
MAPWSALVHMRLVSVFSAPALGPSASPPGATPAFCLVPGTEPSLHLAPLVSRVEPVASRVSSACAVQPNSLTGAR